VAGRGEGTYEFDGPDGKASLLIVRRPASADCLTGPSAEPGVFGLARSRLSGLLPRHRTRSPTSPSQQTRNTTLAFASRGPQPEIERLKTRMGWQIPWYTMTDGFDTDFAWDEWHGHERLHPRGRSCVSAPTSSITAAMKAMGRHLELPRPDRRSTPEEWEVSPAG